MVYGIIVIWKEHFWYGIIMIWKDHSSIWYNYDLEDMNGKQSILCQYKYQISQQFLKIIFFSMYKTPITLKVIHIEKYRENFCIILLIIFISPVTILHGIKAPILVTLEN